LSSRWPWRALRPLNVPVHCEFIVPAFARAAHQAQLPVGLISAAVDDAAGLVKRGAVDGHRKEHGYDSGHETDGFILLLVHRVSLSQVGHRWFTPS